MWWSTFKSREKPTRPNSSSTNKPNVLMERREFKKWTGVNLLNLLLQGNLCVIINVLFCDELAQQICTFIHDREHLSKIKIDNIVQTGPCPVCKVSMYMLLIWRCNATRPHSELQFANLQQTFFKLRNSKKSSNIKSKYGSIIQKHDVSNSLFSLSNNDSFNLSQGHRIYLLASQIWAVVFKITGWVNKKNNKPSLRVTT